MSENASVGGGREGEPMNELTFTLTRPEQQLYEIGPPMMTA